jgi:hypothetical protein
VQVVGVTARVEGKPPWVVTVTARVEGKGLVLLGVVSQGWLEVRERCPVLLG